MALKAVTLGGAVCQLTTWYATLYSSLFDDMLSRRPEFEWLMMDQPSLTVYAPWRAPPNFPAFKSWMYNQYQMDRTDYMLRLHTLPVGIHQNDVYLSFAPLSNNNNNNNGGFLPHTRWQGSFAPWEVLELQANQTYQSNSSAYFVDTPPNFQPREGQSPMVLFETEACFNSVVSIVDHPIRPAANPMMRFPAQDALQFILGNPSLTRLRQLINAVCPVGTCSWSNLRRWVFTMLLPTDQGFQHLHPKAWDYLLNNPSEALRVIAYHIFGPPTRNPDPLPVLVDDTPLFDLLFLDCTSAYVNNRYGGVFGSYSSADAIGDSTGEGELVCDPSLPDCLATAPRCNTTFCEYDLSGVGLTSTLSPHGLIGNPYPSYWFIAQMRDATRVNSTLFNWMYTGQRTVAYEYNNAFKFRAVGVDSEPCDYAYVIPNSYDYETRNAMLHKINNVLIPPDVVERMHNRSIPVYVPSCPSNPAENNNNNNGNNHNGNNNNNNNNNNGGNNNNNGGNVVRTQVPGTSFRPANVSASSTPWDLWIDADIRGVIRIRHSGASSLNIAGAVFAVVLGLLAALINF